jgi:hypothetical protein
MHSADTIQIAASDVLAPASLRDPKVREGMSSAAVRLFLKLADHWTLSVDQRLALLGDISRPSCELARIIHRRLADVAQAADLA